MKVKGRAGRNKWFLSRGGYRCRACWENSGLGVGKGGGQSETTKKSYFGILECILRPMERHQKVVSEGVTQSYFHFEKMLQISVQKSEVTRKYTWMDALRLRQYLRRKLL